MGNNIHTIFSKIEKRFSSKKNKLMINIGLEVLKHEKLNYRTEGFNGRSYQAWKERSRPKPRKILVGDSAIHMRDSTKMTYNKFPSLVMVNPKFYSEQHNEGSGRLAQRQFLSHGYGEDAPQLDKKIDKRIKTFGKSVIGKGNV